MFVFTLNPVVFIINNYKCISQLYYLHVEISYLNIDNTFASALNLTIEFRSFVRSSCTINAAVTYKKQRNMRFYYSTVVLFPVYGALPRLCFAHPVLCSDELVTAGVT